MYHQLFYFRKNTELKPLPMQTPTDMAQDLIWSRKAESQSKIEKYGFVKPNTSDQHYKVN